jgi:hypothetical protein
MELVLEAAEADFKVEQTKRLAAEVQELLLLNMTYLL